MTSSIPYREWAQTITTEYLGSFIREGGSAIKFAVPMDDGTRPMLFSQLAQVARESGYLTAEVDAGQTKVHMMQEVFFRIAEQVDWQSLARQVVEKLSRESGYNTLNRGDVTLLDLIAESSGKDRDLVKSEMNRKISEQVHRHPGLARDFRVAMSELCFAELSGGPDGAGAAQALTDWLTGRNRRVAAVKPYMIFNTITRTNARYMFESLLHWITFAGRSGLLALFDTSRVTLSRNPRDEYLYYTSAAVKDSYEVLRQFIDAIDRLPGCLIVVSPDVAFLSEDNNERGFGAYQALMFRVVDEIRDRQLVNPMSSLVRVSGST